MGTKFFYTLLAVVFLSGCGADLSQICVRLPSYGACAGRCAAVIASVVDEGGLPTDPDQLQALLACGECAVQMGLDIHDMVEQIEDEGTEGAACPLPDEHTPVFIQPEE